MRLSVLMCGLFACLVGSGCRNGCHRDRGGRAAEAFDKIETLMLGEVQVGKELVGLYVAYGYDSAVLAARGKCGRDHAAA